VGVFLFDQIRRSEEMQEQKQPQVLRLRSAQKAAPNSAQDDRFLAVHSLRVEQADGSVVLHSITLKRYERFVVVHLFRQKPDERFVVVDSFGQEQRRSPSRCLFIAMIGKLR
jgi:hypothetical protein